MYVGTRVVVWMRCIAMDGMSEKRRLDIKLLLVVELSSVYMGTSSGSVSEVYCKGWCVGEKDLVEKFSV